MRKASVFCIVSLHQLAGEDLQPHLESLTGSKLKLLNLYIKRAQGRTRFNRERQCLKNYSSYEAEEPTTYDVTKMFII